MGEKQNIFQGHLPKNQANSRFSRSPIKIRGHSRFSRSGSNPDVLYGWPLSLYYVLLSLKQRINLNQQNKYLALVFLVKTCVLCNRRILGAVTYHAPIYLNLLTSKG